MVWFQCEDCGENLKKPKLLSHFHRCSAYKLSCIDCGVVFDQQSVQAHTSCVTEVEKYGPKGMNRGVTGHAAKGNNVKETVPDMDISRGLSTFPPWSCSLCNVNATSCETLELHSQGKKHRSRVKAAAAREKNVTRGGGTDVGTDFTVEGACENESKDVGNNAVQSTSAVDAASLSVEKKNESQDVGTIVVPSTSVVDATSPSVEKKRKKERTDQVGDLISPEVKSEKLGKKQRRATSIVVGTSFIAEESGRLPEVVKDSPEKKRKHVEEHQKEQQKVLLGEDEKGNVKKGRKKDKLVARGASGHDIDELDAFKAAETSGIPGETAENGEQVKKKEKKGRHKDKLCSPVDESVTDGSGQSLVIKDNGVNGLSVHDPTMITHEADLIVSGNHDTGKKSTKSKGLVDGNDSKALEMSEKVQADISSKNAKKHRNKSKEKREAIVHEVSFREWLGVDNDGSQDGTRVNPPRDHAIGGTETLQDVQKTRKVRHKQLEIAGTESTQDGTAKIVKWKKIIRDVLRKVVQSVNGRLKKKDFTRTVLTLAQKAIDSSAISVDRKSLKAELMRQVSSSPKFVVDGEHILFSPKVK